MILQLQREKYDPSFDYFEHANALEKNGERLYSDREGLVKAVGKFFWKIGKDFLQGNFDIFKIIPPSVLMCEFNVLQIFHSLQLIEQKYMNMAAQIQDPVERQKQLCTGMLASKHYCNLQYKGLMPIPIFQNEFLEGILDDGTYLMTRCVKTSPVITGCRLVGPDNLYTYYAEFEPKVDPFGGINKAFSFAFLHDWKFILKDGSEYEYNYPFMKISNYLSNEKVFNLVNITKEDCYIWDKTNGQKVIVEFPEPESKGFFGFMSSKETKNTVHQKNIANMKIMSVDKEGKPYGTILSQGTANTQSFIQFDEEIFWKVSDPVSPWNWEKPGQNNELGCSLNMKYIPLIKENNFDEADRLLEQQKTKTDHELFIRNFPPENLLQEIKETKDREFFNQNFPAEKLIQQTKHTKEPEGENLIDPVKKRLVVHSTIVEQEIQQREYESKMSPPGKKLNDKTNLHSIKFHKEEVNFILNGRNKLKSQVIVENQGLSNIVLKTKSNVPNRYAVKPITCLIKPKGSITVDFIALSQQLGNVSSINDQFLFIHAEVNDMAFDDNNLKSVFISKEVKFFNRKMPVIFYNKSGEPLNYNKTNTVNVKSKNSNTNFIAKSSSPKHKLEIYRSNDYEKSSNAGIPCVVSDLSSDKREGLDMLVKKLKQELEKGNGKVRYLQSQVNNDVAGKKPTGYKMFHLVGVFVLGLYLGKLFMGIYRV